MSASKGCGYWRSVVVMLLVMCPLFGLPVQAQGPRYSVVTVNTAQGTDYWLYDRQHHMATVGNQMGRVIVKGHPGQDAQAWGSAWRPGPMFSDMTQGTAMVDHVVALPEAVQMAASGTLVNGSDIVGAWEMLMRIWREPCGQVSGAGAYSVTLGLPLSSATGPLTLCEISSTYLQDVPLLGQVALGDDGDMRQATLSGEDWGADWHPPSAPSLCPSNKGPVLNVTLLGRPSHVDAVALGYEATEPAIKPSLSVGLTSTQDSAMVVCAAYDATQGQDPTAENVSITPKIGVGDERAVMPFDVSIAFSTEEEIQLYLPLTIGEWTFLPDAL